MSKFVLLLAAILVVSAEQLSDNTDEKIEGGAEIEEVESLFGQRFILEDFTGCLQEIDEIPTKKDNKKCFQIAHKADVQSDTNGIDLHEEYKRCVESISGGAMKVQKRNCFNKVRDTLGEEQLKELKSIIVRVEIKMCMKKSSGRPSKGYKINCLEKADDLVKALQQEIVGEEKEQGHQYPLT